MPSLATLAEFRLRIDGDVAAADEPRAQASLDDASALIRSVAGQAWDAAVPDVAKTTCIAAAKRAFLNPDDITSETLDNYTTVFRTVGLTAEEVRDIRRIGGRSGLWTQPTTRSIDDIPDLPSVTGTPGAGEGPPEEINPFGEFP